MRSRAERSAATLNFLSLVLGFWLVWSGFAKAGGATVGTSGAPVGRPGLCAAIEGEWDTRFCELGANNAVLALATLGDDLYAGGLFSQVGGQAIPYLARWDGQAWHAVGSGVNGTVRALLVVGSNLYAAGEFTMAGGITVNGVACWDGQTWSALGTGLGSPYGSWRGEALAWFGGDLYVGGRFDLAGGQSANAVARWDGTAWHSLGTGPTNGVGWSSEGWGGEAHALEVHDGLLYIGGEFLYSGGLPASRITRWNGSVFLPLTNGMNLTVWTLESAHGLLYAGGDFTLAGTSEVGRIAAWNGTNWCSLASGCDARVAALMASGNRLYVGGYFQQAGEIEALSIALWEGGRWRALDEGVDSGIVDALAVHNGRVYVGGYFTGASGMTANRIACWLESTWDAGVPGANGTIYAAVLCSNLLYVGGDFTSLGGISANRVACWDGRQWLPLGSGVDRTVYALEVGAAGLYVGGAFTNAGGTEARRVACWDGRQWQPLGSGMDGDVYALAADGCQLYVGGAFTNAGGLAANGLARWDGKQWHTLGSGLGGVPNPAARAVAIAYPWLYVGGYFKTVNGVGATNCARCWVQTTDWYSLGDPNGIVYALKVVVEPQLGNYVFIGGEFTAVGGIAARRLARYHVLASSWSPLGTPPNDGADNTVYALGLIGSHRLPNSARGPYLLAGGAFASAGGITAGRIAMWDDTRWHAAHDGATEGVNATVRTIACKDPDAWVGGSFTAAGGVTCARLAAFRPGQWRPLGAAPDNEARTLTVSGYDVLVGGRFTLAGKSSPYVARWDGRVWWNLGSGIQEFSGTPMVRAFATCGNAIYAAGDFSAGVYQWNGSGWSALGPPSDPLGGYAYALAMDHGRLYIGGTFGGWKNHLVQWNGWNWIAVGGPSSRGLNGTVWALCLADSSLYAAGDFTRGWNVDNSPVDLAGIGRWDGTNWTALGSGLNGRAYALAWDGTNLYAGGAFTIAGDTPANRVARWNGAVWTSLGTDDENGVNDTVYGLALRDGCVYVSGAFTAAGTVPVNRFARWNGSAWEAVGNGANGTVYGLAAGPGGLYLAGAFTSVATSVPSRYVARWIGPGDDSDGDGLPDLWEKRYFEDYVVAEADEDPDGDQAVNLHEYIADTAPNCSTSVLAIRSFRNANGWLVGFLSSSNRAYCLQASSQPGTGTTWTNVSPNPTPGTGGLLWLTDSNAVPSRFYRVSVSYP